MTRSILMPVEALHKKLDSSAVHTGNAGSPGAIVSTSNPPCPGGKCCSKNMATSQAARLGLQHPTSTLLPSLPAAVGMPKHSWDRFRSVSSLLSLFDFICTIVLVIKSNKCQIYNNTRNICLESRNLDDGSSRWHGLHCHPITNRWD